MPPVSRRLFLGAASAAFLAAGTGSAAAVSDTIRHGSRNWAFENDSLRATVTYQNGGVHLTRLLNKRAGSDYLSAPSLLFAHELDGADTVPTDDGGWRLGATTRELIAVRTKERSWRVGERVASPCTEPCPARSASPWSSRSTERLRTEGLPIDLSENTSKGKAFWLEAVER
ncbi:hypothetical protein [Streptomyces phaeochromogenes]